MSWCNFHRNCNKSNNYLLKCFIFLLLFRLALTVPRPFSCMSYLEYSLDDEDDFDEYNAVLPPYNNKKLSSENLISEDTNIEDGDSSIESFDTRTVPHRRICESDYTFCFSLWRQTTNGTHIVKQGCWKESTDHNAICSQTECTTSAPTSRNNSLYYCCCSGDMCNEHVAIVEPAPLLLAKNSMGTSTLIDANHNNINNNNNKKNEAIATTSLLFLTTCAFIMGSVMLLGGFISFYYCRRGQSKPVPEEAPLAPAGPGYSSNLRNVDNINLVCMLGSGKYGTVMKGLLHDQEVAVKIFAEHNVDYYINERNIYSLPFMESPALLTYFGYDERLTLEGKREYHLVLSLAPYGCLQDYLAGNVLDFDIFCGMIKSITRGLSHLHTELRHGDMERKPCIAHRDFNTRNILVKSDLSCCLADFGFALKLWGSRYEYKGEQALAETKSINEVGTLRYMAPELLDGAVNLRDCETSLKTVDVYALGLVLWEVSTRCIDLYKVGQQVVPYMSPFQLEVGLHPTFDQMQSLVVRHKARPLFPICWGTGGATAAGKLLRDTCEDCWDHDAEARLTSLCAEERMHEVALLRPHAPTSPLLSANNLVTMKSDNLIQHDNNKIMATTTTTTTTAAAAEDVVVKRRSNEFSTSGDGSIGGGGDSGTLFSPPNRQLYPNVVIINGKLCAQSQKGLTSGHLMEITEKNHLLSAQQQQQQQEYNHYHQKPQQQKQQQQHQLQPYQGRNPCQERNLARIITRQAPVLIERSKKHSFQQNNHDQENSLSCFEYDVSVEELIAGAAGANNNNNHHNINSFHNFNNNNNKYHNNNNLNNTNKNIIYNNDNTISSMGEGFPKQHNYDRNLRGWHGVRALIQKKLFHRYDGSTVTTATTTTESSLETTTSTIKANTTATTTTTTNTIISTTNDTVDGVSLNEKSNLVRQKQRSINYNNNNNNNNNNNSNSNNQKINNHHHQRNLSMISSFKQNIVDNNSIESMSLHATMPSINKRPNNLDLSPMESQKLPQLRSAHTYTGTPAHVQILPRSYSNNLMHKQQQNINSSNIMDIKNNEIDLNLQRRQHSLEVFREVFGQGAGSLEKLRNPSQRVKTPGDVPPSVRKIRATKALSLYDDRMMDSSTLNIL